MVVEVFRRNFLASMVPVIVNAVLNEHQLVIDIVSFVLRGDFHRSRLGEKQRGKILAGWVTRKMRTIAQYSIRDPNGPDTQITEVAEPVPSMAGRANTGTFTRTGGPGSVKGSLRGSVLGMQAQMQNLQLQTGGQQQQEIPGQGLDFGFPAGVAEMPSQRYPESIPERAELATGGSARGSDDTPTEAPRGFPHAQGSAQSQVPAQVYHLSDNGGMGYYDETQQQQQGGGNYNHQQYGATGLSTSPLPTALQPGVPDDNMTGPPPEPQYSNKPFVNANAGVLGGRMGGGQQRGQQQEMRLQDSQQFGNGHGAPHNAAPVPAPGDRWELPSQQRHQQQQQRWQQQEQQQYPQQGQQGGGGLRITNRDSNSTVNENDEWAQEAIMHMNFAGAGPDEMRRYA